MRWANEVYVKPSWGDLIIKRGFLLFPKCINGECRWLEYAEWMVRYSPIEADELVKWISK